MHPDGARPFDSIENAHEFVLLLEEAIVEAKRDLEGHLEQAQKENDERQAHAVHLALLKLNQLAQNMHRSQRNLNDLRTIRRLLFGERPARVSAVPK
jgi:hypothetical protein